MGDIFDTTSHKIATIKDDLKVRSIKGVVLGRVAINGDVYNIGGQKVGYFQENGKIYKGGSCVGTIHADGKVTDYEGQYIGKVTGSNIKLGGAALLLLVR